MKNRINLLILVSLILSGCASDPGKFDIKNDQPFIQIPNNDETKSNDFSIRRGYWI